MSSITTTQSSVERSAHSYPGSLYLLPSDEAERQRLLAMHQILTRVLSDRLIFPTVSLSEKDEVLDVGTGAGAWLCDVRTQLPETVQLYGVDIESRLFPSYKALSPNVHLSVCSATDLPSYWSSKFALVNQRFLICGYTRDQWRRSINEIYRVLTPGGYVQLIEPGSEWMAGPKTAAHMLFVDDFMGQNDMLSRCSVYIPDMLKVAGFTDIKSESAVMKLGKWAGDDGVQARDAMLGGSRGMRDAVMKAGGFGRFASVEEFDRAIDGMAEEWDSSEGSHTTIRVFYGRKPL